MEPGTSRLPAPQILLRPEERVALQHHGGPLRAAGLSGAETGRRAAAHGSTGLPQPNGRARLFPARRPSSQSQQAQRGLGSLGGGRGGRGGEISRRVQEREEQEEEEEVKVPAVQTAVVLSETEHRDDVQSDLRSPLFVILFGTSSLP